MSIASIKCQPQHHSKAGKILSATILPLIGLVHLVARFYTFLKTTSSTGVIQTSITWNFASERTIVYRLLVGLLLVIVYSVLLSALSEVGLTMARVKCVDMQIVLLIYFAIYYLII